MLLGNYQAVLSDSRRVAVPKKFMRELGENLVLAMWYEDCLILVKDNFWEALSKNLVGDSRKGWGVRDLERFILGSAFEITLDDQGRIIIPETLAEYAKIWDKKAKELSVTTKEYIEELVKNDKR